MIITRALRELLDMIRKHEAPKGYGQIYGGAKGVPLNTDVSQMTLKEVRALQDKMVRAGSASSACGGYQFIRKTLQATMDAMKLSGNEVWTPDLQDQMALYLMEGRGLSKYLAGRISEHEFANNLAMEWASLPVVTPIKGASRMLEPGQSYYAGDGLNKAFHSPVTILAVVRSLKSSTAAPQPQPIPDVEPVQPDLPGMPEVPQPPKGMKKPTIQQVALGIIIAVVAAVIAIFFKGG